MRLESNAITETYRFLHDPSSLRGMSEMSHETVLKSLKQKRCSSDIKAQTQTSQPHRVGKME